MSIADWARGTARTALALWAFACSDTSEPPMSDAGRQMDAPPTRVAVQVEATNLVGYADLSLVGIDTLRIDEDGLHAFAAQMPAGTPYTLRLDSAPAAQQCTLSPTSGVAGETPPHALTCTDPVGLQPEAFLKAPEPSEALFGSAVALDDGWLAVGAPHEARSGAVHVFRRSDAGWTHVQTLRSPEEDPEFHLFGFSVALRDGLLAVGARGARPGRVYTYTRTAANMFEYEGTLLHPDTDADESASFGKLLSMNEGHLLAAGDELSGRVYDHGPDGWTLAHTLPNDGIVLYAAVGAEWAALSYPYVAFDCPGGPVTAPVFVYRLDAPAATRTACLTASEDDDDVQLRAHSIAMADEWMVLGYAGKERWLSFFRLDDGRWTHHETIDSPRAAPYHEPVTLALRGQQLLVGDRQDRALCDEVSCAPRAVDTTPPEEGGLYTGAAYHFVLDGDEWGFQQFLTAPNADERDHFGVSVALDGETFAIGATGEGSDGTGPDDDSFEDAGAVYLLR